MSLIELKKSGLPLYLNDENHVMALSGELKLGGYGRKMAADMRGLLADETNLPSREAYYDVYRGIAYPQDEALLARHDYRYDITIVMPGTVNGECKKTSGHYHGYNPQHTSTYAEVYEVMSGTALYILQKSPDFDIHPQDITLDDVILVTVQAGETLLVPPNYGHASVNIGEGPLVFSNLAYVPCPVDYAPVRNYRGMAYYIKKKNNELQTELNPTYGSVRMPQVKFASVKENPALGIRFGRPVYESFRENPQAFDFLAHPDGYAEDIMSMLEYRDAL